MRPLLWKEMRQLGPWLLAGVGLTGALRLLLLMEVMKATFAATWMQVLMPIAAAVVTVAVGVRQIAGERHARTLDFLLARPVPAGVIVWSKFIAGSITLGVLLSCAVALGYADPGLKSDTALLLIRQQVTLGQMIFAVLPRFWFLYALALFFSVLVDRTAKAAALAAVVGMTVVIAAVAFVDVAPFSAYIYWLPFLETSGGLLEVAKNWQFSAMTGLVYGCGTLVVTAISAALLKRSPERYLGSAALAVVAALVIGSGFASAYAAEHRLPEVAPAGSFEFRASGEWNSAIVASGKRAAVILRQHVRLLDLTEPSRFRQVADLEIPLWSGESDWNTDRAAMDEDGTVYLVGQKKQLPIDESQIAMVNAGGLVGAISLGPVRAHEYVSAPIRAGALLYTAVMRNRVCSLVTFDIASRRQVGSLVIDPLRPAVPGKDEGSPPALMLRLGRYLYLSSPSFLTAIDIADAARPVITGRVAVRLKADFLYGFPRPLAWQENRLFEIRFFPETLGSYDLSDPAHPVSSGELTYHTGMNIQGNGRTLYRPWLSGVMEFRADGDGLQAQRYLRGEGESVSAFAATDEYVYVLTEAGSHDVRSVHVFRTGK